jgi:hypothetical protein
MLRSNECLLLTTTLAKYLNSLSELFCMYHIFLISFILTFLCFSDHKLWLLGCYCLTWLECYLVARLIWFDFYDHCICLKHLVVISMVYMNIFLYSILLESIIVRNFWWARIWYVFNITDCSKSCFTYFCLVSLVCFVE